jgi:hypothetical protein
MIDLVSLGGIALGKLAYIAKKQVVDGDKKEDEGQLQFVTAWLFKQPISVIISVILAYGAVQVMPGSESIMAMLVQGVTAGIAGDSVANQKGK